MTLSRSLAPSRRRASRALASMRFAGAPRWDVCTDAMYIDHERLTRAVLACGQGSPFKAFAQVHPTFVQPQDAKQLTVPVATFRSGEEPEDVMRSFHETALSNEDIATNSVFGEYHDFTTASLAPVPISATRPTRLPSRTCTSAWPSSLPRPCPRRCAHSFLYRHSSSRACRSAALGPALPAVRRASHPDPPRTGGLSHYFFVLT